MVVISPFVLCAEKGAIQTSGDVLFIALPTAATTGSLLDGKKQTRQFMFQHLTVAAITLGFKGVVDRERPDGSNHHSFPSGHTSTTFSSASFIAHQYGWRAGVPAYLLASWTGYSRVYARKHHWSDVIAGAGIGLLTHDAFFHRTNVGNITPFIGPDHTGFKWRYDWR